MKKILYYRERPAPDRSLVFALPERAELVSQIRDAVKSSITWGEFKQKMPQDEYAKVLAWYLEGFEEENYVPNENDMFSHNFVGGFDDGDYPYWLQQEMDKVLPKDILDKYSEKALSIFNGGFYIIKPEVKNELITELEERCYKVVERTDLEFWRIL